MSRAGRTRRQFITLFGGAFGALSMRPARSDELAGPPVVRGASGNLDIYEHVVPRGGIATQITFADSIAKLVVAGMIDPARYREYAGVVPAWIERALLGPSSETIVFGRETAPSLLILLWAVGLGNKTLFNLRSPIATVRIPGFASTGGWTLGRQDGYLYFNGVDAVPLTKSREQTVLDVATRTYRPCCDNSTFFQDCNHGSALLGLLELAASQGATSGDLYRIALTANSYWFSENYAKIALYFLHFEHKSWHEVDPVRVLSADFSSASGWRQNVDARLQQAGVSLPGAPGEQSEC